MELTGHLPSSHHYQVDPLYLFHPQARLSIDKETRVKFSSKELEAKQKELISQGTLTSPAKFPTECFFLTAHCIYITWTSFYRRYRHGFHEIRYFKSAIAQLERSKKPDKVSFNLHALMSA